jgi:hypothetical protein
VRWWIVLRAASLASPSTLEMSLETSPSTVGLLPGRLFLERSNNTARARVANIKPHEKPSHQTS